MKKEEALQELRSFIGQLTEGCQDVIKVLIPELEESEDERIRKELIELISCMHDADPRKKRWIAWLEKQGEQKPAEWSEEDKGNLLDVKCIIDEIWHDQDVREEIDHSGEELESLWHWLDNIWQKVAYPKPSWKPSEEQIEALENSTALNEEQGAHLYSLLCDLKKLL